MKSHKPMTDRAKIEILMDALRDVSGNIDVSTIRPGKKNEARWSALNVQAQNALAACGDENAKEKLESWGESEPPDDVCAHGIETGEPCEDCEHTRLADENLRRNL